MRRILALIVFTPLLLAACAQTPEAASGAPQAVEAYLQALVNKERDRFMTLICPAFEAEGRVEFDSFGAVEAKLDGVSCAESGKDGETALVQCQGSIVATYQGESNRVLELKDNTYRVVQDDGEWKMCGYG